ncbi:MAG: hypothetical protein BWX79_01620 [Alphaproteobacteria bacterium ADurb.Bin100]|nr:MAG: hypothetical protein BWX79_01620 [Alphaproteobacteria bacterium ADurb.Bin100]
MVVGALGHAPQAVQLGQHHGQCATFAQHREHARRLRLHQPARQFLPHALGHQMVGLAVLHHFAHQLHGLGRHREIGEARRKARHAQDAHRVFAEGVGHMAQHAGLQVALAAVGVDQVIFLPILAGSQRRMVIDSYRIDSKIAPRQVFLQRHLGRGVDGEALVAARGLALGARQRVLLAGLRMQEDREILAHRQVAQRAHLLGRGADDHPVPVLDRQAQQLVAHRSTHPINLHRRSVSGDCDASSWGGPSGSSQFRPSRYGSSKSRKSFSATASSIHAFTPGKAHRRSM